MADHLRKQIRTAIYNAVNGLASTGQNVFLSRRIPLAEEHIPALCIYTLTEEAAAETMGSTRRYRRELDVGIECVSFDTEALDDELDRLAYEVEVAIAADVTLGGLAYNTQLTSTRVALQPQRIGDRAIGSALLTFRVSYRALYSDPSTN